MVLHSAEISHVYSHSSLKNNIIDVSTQKCMCLLMGGEGSLARNLTNSLQVKVNISIYRRPLNTYSMHGTAKFLVQVAYCHTNKMKKFFYSLDVSLQPKKKYYNETHKITVFQESKEGLKNDQTLVCLYVCTYIYLSVCLSVRLSNIGVTGAEEPNTRIRD